MAINSASPGPLTLGALPCGPVEVGGDEAEAPDAPERAYRRRDVGEVQDRPESLDRDVAENPQGPPDVIRLLSGSGLSRSTMRAPAP